MVSAALCMLRRFGPEFAGERRAFAAMATLGLLGVAAGVASPWPLQWLIDGLLAHAKLPAPIAAIAERSSPALAAIAIAGVSLAFALARVLSGTQQRLVEARIRERLGLAVRDRMLQQLLSLPPTIATAHRSGELVDRLVTDSNLFVRLVTKTAPEALQHLGTTAFTLAAMFAIEPRLGALGLAALPPLAWLAHRHAHTLGDASRAKRGSEGMLAGVAQEVVRGHASLQASGESELARDRFREVALRSLARGAAEARAGLRMERSLQIAQAFALAAMLALGGVLVLRGRLTVGQLTVFVAYLSQLLKPVEKINELASALAKGFAGGERLLDLLDREPAVSDRAGARELTPSQGRLAMRGVRFAYAGGPPVLRGVDLALAPGLLTALTGPSGAGKSTIVQLLARVFDPERGEVTLDGQPLAAFTLRSLRRQIAVMSQRGHLFAGTLRGALSELAPGSTDSELMRALDAVALGEFAASLPRGLDTPLGEDGVNLSGGQRQRLAFARIVLSRRPIVLLDEPTASVDAISQRILLDAMRRLAQQRTLLVVTHRSAVLEAADVVLRIEGGVLRGDTAAESAA